MEAMLEQMGLRQIGDFTLHSGAKSSVKWDIEKLFYYPEWMRIEVLRPWIWEIGLHKPGYLVGIRTGGLGLAHDIGKCLNVYVFNDEGLVECGNEAGRRCGDKPIIIDDVLTTGNTLRECLSRFDKAIAIAVLVNRSGSDTIKGLPVLSGFYADRV